MPAVIELYHKQILKAKVKVTPIRSEEMGPIFELCEALYAKIHNSKRKEGLYVDKESAGVETLTEYIQSLNNVLYDLFQDDKNDNLKRKIHNAISSIVISDNIVLRLRVPINVFSYQKNKIYFTDTNDKKIFVFPFLAIENTIGERIHEIASEKYLIMSKEEMTYFREILENVQNPGTSLGNDYVLGNFNLSNYQISLIKNIANIINIKLSPEYKTMLALIIYGFYEQYLANRFLLQQQSQNIMPPQEQQEETQEKTQEETQEKTQELEEESPKDKACFLYYDNVSVLLLSKTGNDFSAMFSLDDRFIAVKPKLRTQEVLTDLIFYHLLYKERDDDVFIKLDPDNPNKDKHKFSSAFIVLTEDAGLQDEFIVGKISQASASEFVEKPNPDVDAEESKKVDLEKIK